MLKFPLTSNPAPHKTLPSYKELHSVALFPILHSLSHVGSSDYTKSSIVSDAKEREETTKVH